MHHIVSDGWSSGVLLRELAALYSAYVTGRPLELLALPIQYADYALWQREWLRGPLRESLLAYWREQLGEAPELLALPSDHPRPLVQSHRGARHAALLPQALQAALNALSQREGVTLFMT